MKPDKPVLTVRLTPPLYEGIRKLAHRQETSMESLARKLFAEAIAQDCYAAERVAETRKHCNE